MVLTRSGKNYKDMNVLEQLEYDLKEENNDEPTPTPSIQKYTKYSQKNKKYLKLTPEEKLEMDYKTMKKNEKHIKSTIRNKGYSFTTLKKYIDEVVEKYNPELKHIKNLMYHKRDIISIRFDEDKYEHQYFTVNKIKTISQKLSDLLKENNVNGKIATAMLYGNLNWKSGYLRNFGDEVKLYNPNELYNLEVEYPEPDKIRSFNIYLALGSKSEGGNNKFNDCLYDCLKYYIFDLSEYFKSPEELKNYLGLKRFDKISLDKIDLIEKKLKTYKINVRGDFIRISTIESNKEINILLKNEHYSVEKFKKKNLTPNVRYSEKKPIVFNNYEFIAYDGITKWNTTKEEINKLIYNYNSEYIVVQTEKKTKKNQLTIEEEYENFIKNADLLKEKTKGLINLYKTGSIHDTSLDLFDRMSKFIHCDEILQDEAIWIKLASYSAILYSEKYTGECYKYDVKSLYPHLMNLSTLKFPVKRGEFKIIENIEKYPQFGIYRCKVYKNDDTDINKITKLNYHNYYTSNDITNFLKYGFKVELIQDNTPNFLYYSRDKLITYNEVFKNYVKLLYPLKEKENIKIAKDILNRLWGSLSEVDKTKQYVDTTFKIDDDAEILEIYPSKFENDKTIIKTVKINSYYKSNFARLCPYLISKGRTTMTDIMHPYKENIKRIQTDGFIVNKKIHENRIVQLGELKYEGYNPNGEIINCINEVKVI